MKISPLESAGCKFILVKSERDGVLQDGGRNAEQVSARTRDELETFGLNRVHVFKRGVGVDGQDVVWVGCRDATSIIRWVDGAGKLLTRRDLHPNSHSKSRHSLYSSSSKPTHTRSLHRDNVATTSRPS